MLKIGKRQKLIINNFSKVGAYLDAGTGDTKDNILLPNNEIVDKDLNVGDEVEVLLYKDSEDRVIATLRQTEVILGSLKWLEVVDIHEKLGAFLDWGLNKDIILPLKQQTIKVKIGKKYLVGIYEDSKKRLAATMYINKFLLPAPENIKKNMFVEGTVYGINLEIGVFVAVEDRYFGLIPKNEYFKDFEVGDKISCRVIRIREDGKIDLTPRELGFVQMNNDGELILEKMKLLGKNFDFNDKSDPYEIEEYFKISKKAFKRAIGGLLKSGKIEKIGNKFQIKKESK